MWIDCGKKASHLQKPCGTVKKIDIGTVHEIDPDYLEGLETENSVNGAYRDLRQYLPMLAKFYLSKNIK